MNINLQKFADVAAVRGSTVVNLNSDQRGVTRSGRVVSWVKGLASTQNRRLRAENRQVTHAFIGSLKSAFGDALGEQVVGQSGLSDRLQGGKPLRARDITVAVRLGQQLRDEYRQANSALIENYNRPVSEGSDASRLTLQLDKVVQRLLGTSPAARELAGRVDLTGLQREVAAALNLKGKDGRQFITTEMAAETVDKVIASNLTKAACDLAREQLSLAGEQSPARLALENNFLRQSLEPAGFVIQTDNITADVVADLNAKLSNRANARIYEKLKELNAQSGAAGDEGLILSAGELQDVAGEVMEPFVRERLAAWEAVGHLPGLEPQLRAALQQQVSHDNTRAELTPAFHQAREQLADRLPLLGQATTATELADTLATLSDSFMQSLQGAELTADNREEIMQSQWRFLLASASDEQLHAMVEQMNRPDSQLGQFFDGAYLFHLGFTLTPGYQPAHRPAVEKAAEYNYMLSTLAAVLHEKTGAPARELPMGRLQGEDTTPTDAEINLLRNAGVDAPAPDRLGHDSNGMIPLSRKALAKLQDLYTDEYNQDKTIQDGLLEKCRRDLGRSHYKVGDNDLGKGAPAARVEAALREFCTENGQTDEAMLLGISRFAWQVTQISGLLLFAPGNEQVAPFQHMPSLKGGGKPAFDIAKNEQGNVVLTARVSGPADLLMSHESELIDLDADTSRMTMEIQLELDAAGDFQPTVRAAGLDYALHPAQDM